MKKYLCKVKNLILLFLSFDVQQVFKVENARTNALSKLVASLPADLQKGTFFEVLKKSSFKEPQDVQQIDEEPNWIDPLHRYLKQGERTSSRLEGSSKIRHQALFYVLYKDKLYMQSFSLPLLKCLCPSQSDYALREVHEGIFRNHLRGRSLAYKILQQGYIGPQYSKMQLSLYGSVIATRETPLNNINRQYF